MSTQFPTHVMEEVQSLRTVGTQELAGNANCWRHKMPLECCGICKPTEGSKKVVDYLGEGCVICNAPIEQRPSGRKRVYCLACSTHDHGARNRWQAVQNQLKLFTADQMFRHMNSFRYLSFDGRYEGPNNLCFTIVTGLKVDRGYRPMPVDVHVKPIDVKFNIVTPEDVDWAQRQRAFPHSHDMGRVNTNFCPHCTNERSEVVMSLKRDVWIDRGRVTHQDVVVNKFNKKITRGKYVLQGHVCNAHS